MIDQQQAVSGGFFKRLWRGLHILAEGTEVSQTELLTERVTRLERELRQSDAQAKPGPGASND